MDGTEVGNNGSGKKKKCVFILVLLFLQLLQPLQNIEEL